MNKLLNKIVMRACAVAVPVSPIQLPDNIELIEYRGINLPRNDCVAYVLRSRSPDRGGIC